jgi:hypothetical protein
MASISTVSEVTAMIQGGDQDRRGHRFKLIGVVGRPIGNFAFETRDEADNARNAMLEIASKVKVILPVPHVEALVRSL